MPALLPKVFHPRALVVVSAILDDQNPASPGVSSTWTAIPKMVQYRKNSARKADTARVELDYRDFPLDPRMIKDVLMSLHVEDALDPRLPMVATALNKRFVGLVDKPETTLSNSGDRVVFEARDYTGIWLDRKLSNAEILTLSPLTPLSTLVEQIRVLVTPAIPPVVFTDPTTAPLVPGILMGKTAFSPNKKAPTAWDFLSTLLGRFGLVPVFDVDILTVRTATRFAPSLLAMIYGENVERLMFRRSATKEPKTRKIVVNAWDPVKGVPVQGVYIPPGAVRIKKGANNAIRGTLDEISYNVEGSYTPEDLIIIAKRIYDEQATEQVEGDLETKDMRDAFLPLGASLLGASNGDVLAVGLGPDLQSSIAGMSAAEAVAFLGNPIRPNSVNPVAAAALVQAWTLAGKLAATFYVKEATHTWERDGGYSLKISFLNFVIGQGT
jgi:hypothetical protein